MQTRRLRALFAVLIALSLATAHGGEAHAAYNIWYPNGYQLEGITNPITFPNNYQYASASFSKTPNGSLWLGVQAQYGDWCGDASNPGFDFESSWVWQYNYTNSWIQFTARPYWNNTCSNHIYGWRGWHNIHDVNSTLVDYYGTTYEVSR